MKTSSADGPTPRLKTVGLRQAFRNCRHAHIEPPVFDEGGPCWQNSRQYFVEQHFHFFRGFGRDRDGHHRYIDFA